MAAILIALDQNRSSGVREQLCLSGKPLFGLLDNDPKARRLLVEAGMSKWATGGNYRWFLVSDHGLHNLATWARTTQGMAYSTATTGSCAAAMGRAIQEEAEIRSAMQAEAMQHRADVAKANLHVERARREAEIDSILAEAPMHDEANTGARKPMMFNS